MIKLAFRSVKYLLMIAVIAAAGYFYVLPKLETAKNEKIETEKQAQTNDYLIVTKVIDGDTFKMSNGEKVRLMGIDTPEKFESDKLDRQSGQSGRDKETIKKLGEASSEYVRKLVEGKKVTLVKDPGYDDRDKYNGFSDISIWKTALLSMLKYSKTDTLMFFIRNRFQKWISLRNSKERQEKTRGDSGAKWMDLNS